MRLRQLTLALLLTLGLAANAANTKTTVEQVTSAVQLTTDVDYTITSTTPFTTAGSVDIQSTEHAVLIFEKIKPSKVLSTYMGKIYINGVKAVDGTNCQVKMYGRGTIVFPYGQDFKPLTCYTEKNYGGESCSDYTEGHDGNGFMKTLSTANLNNQIRSFKLKRGYMVTFAIGTAGWGYSRCFVADQADLEISSLPSILNGRISSYRLFKWHNTHKAGLANNTDQAANQAVNSSWCYDWGEGNASKEPDTEWVVNHIYEDWPPISTCGRVTQTSHMKNNNEPRNGSDDHPQDLETILNNWPNIMRTGMRLCSPSSWDGSDFWNGTGFIKTFLDSIDARGWRCDIVDAHAYWESTGQFNNLANYWYPNMHRPIWVSEWIWGSCWSGNQKGFWTKVSNPDDTSEATQQILYDGTKPILDILNAAQCVERYAYWNSWSAGSKIYVNGNLTKLGEYYATMDVPQGYNASMQFIPTDPPLKPIGELTGTFDKKSKAVKLSWTDPNGELTENYVIQRQSKGVSFFSDIAKVAHKEQTYPNGSANLNVSPDTLTTPGFYTYRVVAFMHDGSRDTTNVVNVEVDPAQGIANFQYGNIIMDKPDSKNILYTTDFSGDSRRKHAVFTGIPSNNSPTYYASPVVTNSLQPGMFTIAYSTWSTSLADITATIEQPFLALGYGNHKFDDLDCEVGYVSSKTARTYDWTDTTTVTFSQAFPEGVIPVVLTELRNPIDARALSIRIFDVTNTGFKFIIYPETVGISKLSSYNVNYLAITPGFANVNAEEEIMIAAGHGTDNLIYSSSARPNSFKVPTYDETSETTTMEPISLYSPIILGALQTNNYPTVCMLRRSDETVRKNGVTLTTGIRVKRVLSKAITIDGVEVSTRTSDEPYRDQLGWVVIANYVEGSSAPTAIEAVPAGKGNGGNTLRPRIVDGRVVIDGITSFDIYSMTGAKLPSNAQLAPGFYVIRANGKSVKMLVK